MCRSTVDNRSGCTGVGRRRCLCRVGIVLAYAILPLYALYRRPMQCSRRVSERPASYAHCFSRKRVQATPEHTSTPQDTACSPVWHFGADLPHAWRLGLPMRQHPCKTRLSLNQIPQHCVAYAPAAMLRLKTDGEFMRVQGVA